MSLTRAEKERISDSRLKIRAAADSLSQVDPEKLPDFQSVQHCLDDVEKSLGAALRGDRTAK